MINKIQYLRKLPAIGMPGAAGNAPIPRITPNPNIGATPSVPAPVPTNPVVPIIPVTTTNTSGISSNTAAANTSNLWQVPVTYDPAGAPITPDPLVPIIRDPQSLIPRQQRPPVITYPIPANLIFHSINDLTATSNQPVVHSRDAAGNIILINDPVSDDNQLLTIESISYTVPNINLDSVINTQFNYFKFPPSFKSIEVSDELSLTDAIEEVDTISTRYTPSATSGRQSGLGRPPILKAGFMIAEGVDDSLVQTEPHGYYGRDNNSYSILNMETVLAGTSQLKPSKFIITPDMIDTGEDIFFRIRIDHYMSGNKRLIDVPHPSDPWGDNGSGWNEFVAHLKKITGTTGGSETVMLAGSYPSFQTIDPNDPSASDLRTRLNLNLRAIQRSLATYTRYVKQYDNLLATIGDRQTNQQRVQLAVAKNRIPESKLIYDNAVQDFLDTQSKLARKLRNSGVEYDAEPTGQIYEMLYLIDIKSARPYDEYWIETRCATYSNSIQKDSTYWEIVPISKILNAF